MGHILMDIYKNCYVLAAVSINNIKVKAVLNWAKTRRVHKMTTQWYSEFKSIKRKLNIMKFLVGLF